MPVFHLGRDIHHITGLQKLSGLSFLLVPALTGYTEEYLIPAVVDMPEVPTARLEGDVDRAEVFILRQYFQVNGTMDTTAFTRLSLRSA